MKPIFNKKVLSNGAVVLHEKRDIPVTAIAITAKIGYGFEQADSKGISHFIEHMAFKGTLKRNAGQIAAELEKIGGELNAFTSDEITTFHVKLPSRHLALGIDVLSDIYFNPLIKQEELEKERKVIIEEIKMYHDDPRRYVLDRIKELSYKPPFGLKGTGTAETLNKMKRGDLADFHKENYVASNTIICVVGNNSFEEVLRLAERIQFKTGKSANKINTEMIFEKKVEKRKNIHQANLVLSIPAPRVNDEKKYAAGVFTAILGEGMSSKLFKEIREKRGLAYAVKTFLDNGLNFGTIDFYVGAEKGKEEIVKELILKEISKMKDITEKEIEDAKEQLVGGFDVEREDSRDTAVRLSVEELCGNALDYYDFEKKIRAVSIDEVRAFSKIKDYSFIALVPED